MRTGIKDGDFSRVAFAARMRHMIGASPCMCGANAAWLERRYIHINTDYRQR